MGRVVDGLEVDVLAHATEDEEKVLKSLREVLPDEVACERTVLRGHYGNPIVKIEGKCRGRKAQEVFDRLIGRMGKEELEKVVEDLERKIDGSCRLHLRLCKQEAFEGRLRLATGDDVIHLRVKIAARPARPERAAEVLREHIKGVLG
jgi:hypothetical protein